MQSRYIHSSPVIIFGYSFTQVRYCSCSKSNKYKSSDQLVSFATVYYLWVPMYINGKYISINEGVQLWQSVFCSSLFVLTLVPVILFLHLYFSLYLLHFLQVGRCTYLQQVLSTKYTPLTMICTRSDRTGESVNP